MHFPAQGPSRQPAPKGRRQYAAVSALIFSLIATTVAAGGLATWLLYRTSLAQEQARLLESVESQAQLIGAVFDFDQRESADFPGGAAEATLSQILAANESYRLSRATGELTLARKSGSEIVYLMRHSLIGDRVPAPVPWDGVDAEPMRRALRGESGSVVARDYRGAIVVAGYTFIPGLGVGLVSKADLSEVRAPYRRVALMVILTTAVFALLGARFVHGAGKRLVDAATAAQLRAEEMAWASERRAALLDLEGRISTAHGVAATYEAAVDDTLTILTSRIKDAVAVISYRNPSTGKVIVAIGVGEQGPRLGDSDLEPFERLAELDLTHGHPRFSADLSKDERVPNHVAAWAREHGIRQAITTPISRGSEGFGMLSLLHSVAGGVPDERVGTLHTIGRSLGAALDRLAKGAALQHEFRQHMQTSRHLSTIFRVARAGAWDWMIGDEEHFWTPENFHLFGLEPTPDGMIGYDRWRALIHPEDIEAVEDVWERAVRSKESFRFRYRVAQHNDGYRWLECYGQFMTSDEDGSRLSGFNIDVSDLVERELEAGRAESKYQEFVKHTPALIHVTDADEQLTFVNPAWCLALRYRPAEVLGRSITDFIPPDEVPDLRRRFELVSSGKRYSNVETTLVAKDGHSVYIDAAIVPVMEDDTFMGIQVFSRDVSIEFDTRQQLKRLSAAVEHSPVAVLITDRDGVIQYVNPTFTRFNGYRLEDVVGKHPQLLESEQSSPETRASIGRALHAGESWTGELIHRRADGTTWWADLRISPVLDDKGVVTHFVGIQEDITERKRAAQELEEERRSLSKRVTERTEELTAANAQLARAMRAKDEFLASMSHELRTPLNSVLTLTESLQEGVYGPLTTSQTQSLTTVAESGRHLLDLINDILDLAKIGSGHLELSLSRVNLEELAEASLRFVTTTAEKKGLTLRREVRGNVATLIGDERRLKQILINLLDNAVKFTKQGEVGLEIQADRDTGEARFTVWDTGVGLAPEDMPRLFVPFAQLDTGLDRQYEGTGLGLALATRLAELHGGRLSVMSDGVGMGSRFTLVIPINESLDPPEDSPRIHHPTHPKTVNHGTILLVDDNQQTQRAFSKYLRVRGFTVHTSPSGEDALARLQEDDIDVVLMDVQMPGMSGLEATAQIRAIPGLESLPIIAVTALAMPGDRERCMAAGMTGYLTKPVRLTELEDAVVRAIADYRSGEASGSTPGIDPTPEEKVPK
jgi:two-component system, sensor histidine kinase and response regulator